MRSSPSNGGSSSGDGSIDETLGDTHSWARQRRSTRLLELPGIIPRINRIHPDSLTVGGEQGNGCLHPAPEPGPAAGPVACSAPGQPPPQPPQQSIGASAAPLPPATAAPASVAAPYCTGGGAVSVSGRRRRGAGLGSPLWRQAKLGRYTRRSECFGGRSRTAVGSSCWNERAPPWLWPSSAARLSGSLLPMAVAAAYAIPIVIVDLLDCWDAE